jgi:hypothetical protein
MYTRSVYFEVILYPTSVRTYKPPPYVVIDRLRKWIYWVGLKFS